MAEFRHQPVLAGAIVEIFRPVPPGWIVDATVGGGGHSRLLLEARPDLRVLGIDRDPAALAATAEALAPFGDRVVLRAGHFADVLADLRRSSARREPVLASTMTELPIPTVSGVLFDLGVSSPQLDRPERGFSYRSDGPLDMRMDPTQSWSAADVVNGYSEEELADVLRTYGDERHARRIARAIVTARPIESTAELATVVREAIPAPARRRGGHPAKRTFQAIRIEVNGELERLGDAIDHAVEVTAPGGRIGVLAYHSGEDRIVKARFRHHATGGCTCPPGLPCICDAVSTVRLLKAGSTQPSAEEIAANRRAESARLRVAEKLPPPDPATRLGPTP